MRFESIFNSTNNNKNVREVNHISLVLILKIYKTIIIKKTVKIIIILLNVIYIYI
jgi:hypothetical protein